MIEDDLALFFEHQQDPIANQMAVFPPQEHGAFMVHWKKILANASITKRTILVGDTVVGSVVCFEQSNRFLLGYWIDREFWGRGIASHAVATFLDIAEARPLFAYVAKGNIASIRVLEKSGFEVFQDTQSVSESEEKPSDDQLFVLS
jgi:RimJ/RimL family protein N-acetyltransferase